MSAPHGRRGGLLLHPTSLPGPHGIGDFGPDAYAWVDFLQAAGVRLWQVMPLGPTGYGDSPYQSPGAFAANPNLISLQRLQENGLLEPGDLHDAPAFPDDRVDYGSVLPFKQVALTRAFERFRRDADAAARERFEAFRREQAHWLDDYALYAALKAAHGGRPWNEWPPELRDREPDALARARAVHAEAMEAEAFRQFLARRQWQDLARYARERDVWIVGDLPIFVAYDSADAWANRERFHLDARGAPTVVAGVPPDYFSATGQLWGNPLYDWARLREEGYAWWIARLRAALEYYDLVRIDHFRGFEAYWEVPAGEDTAMNGRWAAGPGQAFFDALRAEFGSLPILAEDLGVITPEVEALRDANGFPGMKVLQFAFAGGPSDPYLPHNHVRDCVVYTGTHDNDTTLGWYRTAPEVERDHVRRYLGRADDAMPRELVRAALASVADLAVVPLQDVLGLGSEARMNTPGRAEGNWAWRFRWQDVPEWLAPWLREWLTLYGRVPSGGPRDTAYRQSVR